MYLSTKADLERNGHDTSNLLNFLGTSEEAIEDLRFLVVELIDGYHRYGALVLLRDQPHLLLNPDLHIDWKLLAGLYPSWIKLDRYAIGCYRSSSSRLQPLINLVLFASPSGAGVSLSKVCRHLKFCHPNAGGRLCHGNFLLSK